MYEHFYNETLDETIEYMYANIYEYKITPAEITNLIVKCNEGKEFINELNKYVNKNNLKENN